MRTAKRLLMNRWTRASIYLFMLGVIYLIGGGLLTYLLAMSGYTLGCADTLEE